MDETLHETIVRDNLFADNTSLIVGVSGGVDSVALLHALIALCARHFPRLRIVAATFDHGIPRSGMQASAAHDVAHVQQLAEAWGVPFATGRGDVWQRVQRVGGNLEAEARRQRYAFLADVARQHDTNQLVTAHHATDQAETLLMQLVRGTASLVGMRTKSQLPGHPGMLLLRPLLRVPRAEIMQYARSHGLSWRDDPSNDEERFTRNFLRTRVLPLLRDLNPELEQAFVRASKIAEAEQDYFDEMLYERLPALRFPSEQVAYFIVSKDEFVSWPLVIQRRAIHRMATLLGASPRLEHVEAAVQFVHDQGVGRQYPLTGTAHLVMGYDDFTIRRMDVDDAQRYQDYAKMDPKMRVIDPVPLCQPIRLSAEWTLTLCNEKRARHEVCIRLIDTHDLLIRTRQPGDIFRPPGLDGHSKKLKDWFIDRKVPAVVRDTLPLIVWRGEVIGIPLIDGWQIAHSLALPPRPVDGGGHAGLTIRLERAPRA